MRGNKGQIVTLEDDPLWYKDAVVYQLHVKTFCDSNGDGIGDFKGLTQRLWYLRSLGITAVWVLPFYPSPLRDDGYDIADYFGVHPHYGTLRDFKEFLRQARRHGLRVITELVINHTSEEHPWFKRARISPPGSVWRDFYVWSDTTERYADSRIIFKDFESSNWTWDPVARSYYWHRFYSHQPDLNYDNPQVQKEIFRVMDYWFEMGVDGMRLDAVPYLFEREGTHCENLPETYDYLKSVRRHVDEKFKNKMLLAEANQWPEDAVAYFGDGDECHMAFHFPLMPRMYMGLQMEDRFPITDILEQTPAIPASCQWAVFLRNHDELTLEMVTDEERDYMYRVYAKDGRSKVNLGIRRRLVPLLNNDRKKIELMNILLFSLPGTPIIYYGDEIGMGDNYYLGDRDGVRTPMQWSPDRNAGFSKANPHQLYLPVIIDPEYHYETINVETQEKNLSSILWWMRRVIAMRKKYKAFSQGGLEILWPENPKVLTFIRKYGEEIILVVINLSRFSQVVELDLAAYADYAPEELFSQNRFPTIRKTPYVITMGPHNHFWLLLRKPESDKARESKQAGVLRLQQDWGDIFKEKHLRQLEEDILPDYLRKCRWFGGKAELIQGVKVVENIAIDGGGGIRLVIVSVRYAAGGATSYFLPMSFAQGKDADAILDNTPRSVIARVFIRDSEGIVYDGAYDPQVHNSLFSMIAQKKKIKETGSEFVGYSSRRLRTMLEDKKAPLASSVLRVEQSNTSVLYENLFFLKVFRRLEEGMNPDAEIVRFLTEEKRFSSVPAFCGSIEYRRAGQSPTVICLLQACVPNEGDAWRFTLDRLEGYYENVLARRDEIMSCDIPPQAFLGAQDVPFPYACEEYIGGFYLEMIRLLGRRTGEMHLALSGERVNPDFSPEAFSTLYQRAVYQSMWGLTRKVWQTFGKNLKRLPAELQEEAVRVFRMEKEVLACHKHILQKKYSAMKIRIHGDYHLGQVLFTGKDFMIIDFEGEPVRPLSERRLKRSALRDVAGMIRSFHYAAYGGIFLRSSVRKQDIAALEKAANIWYCRISAAFLESYLNTIGNASFVPNKKEEFESLLMVFILEKAVYELGYELNNRPDWVIIPLRGIQNILENVKARKG